MNHRYCWLLVVFVVTGLRAQAQDEWRMTTLAWEDAEAYLPEVAPLDTLPLYTDFVPYESEPVLLNLEEYKRLICLPAAAVDSGGRIYLRVLFDASGAYMKHVVLKSWVPEHHAAIVEPLPSLRAVPAVYAGRNTAAWINLRIDVGKLTKQPE